jgi:hypothetical protein
VIAGRITLKGAVWRDQSTNLTFLPVVTCNRLLYPSDILSADATRKLFENLQSKYDYVLVDLTPLMPIVDTRATRAFVDCYVCVIELGRTTSDAVITLSETHTISVKTCSGLYSIKRTSIGSASTTRRAKTIIGTSIMLNTASQNEPIFARMPSKV